MSIYLLRSLFHNQRRLTGVMLSRCRLHRLEYAHRDGVSVVLKSRRPGSRLAIMIGNLYLRLGGNEVEVLNDREWLEWELAVDAALKRGVVIEITSDPYKNPQSLLSRVCPGRPLRTCLRDSALSLDEKVAAFRWAISSLNHMHHQQVDWGHGVRQSFSHGDATVNNVIINTSTRSAFWIDFDTRHIPDRPESDRHADDLRALVFSAAENLPLACYSRLAAEFAAAELEPATICRFRERLTVQWRSLNTFQLAQSPLSWGAFHALSRELFETFPEQGREPARLARDSTR